MRVLMILLLACVEAPALLAQNQPETLSSGFELEGDKLGESFASFVSQHPKVRCVDSTTRTKNCYQWENVSIFGLTAHADAGCSPENHSSAGCVQALTATFKDQHLTLLSYAVGGIDKSNAVAKLKKKYENPSIDTHEATIWMSGNGVLSVVVGKATK